MKNFAAPKKIRKICARTIAEKTGLVTSLLGFGFRGRDWSLLNLITVGDVDRDETSLLSTMKDSGRKGVKAWHGWACDAFTLRQAP